MSWTAGYPCPHCGIEHSSEVPMCPDRNRWTPEERDAWRALARRHNPVPLVSAQLARDAL